MLAGILVVSVLLRVGVALYLGDVVDAPPLLTDQRSYDALGARLIAGHGFSFDQGWYPFTPAVQQFQMWRAMTARRWLKPIGSGGGSRF
jgi:hypothetical protein